LVLAGSVQCVIQGPLQALRMLANACRFDSLAFFLGCALIASAALVQRDFRASPNDVDIDKKQKTEPRTNLKQTQKHTPKKAEKPVFRYQNSLSPSQSGREQLLN
jgi:hypothetical protein